MMKQSRYLVLLLLLGYSMNILADGCFELVNDSIYAVSPTNYLVRGGEGWTATGAAVEPTKTMTFTSPYDYVMLTGGNIETEPGTLNITITPEKGIDTLTFLIAKPCKSDKYSVAYMLFYADSVLLEEGRVMAGSRYYDQVTLPINKPCKAFQIEVLNVYSNYTADHNNRIAFAHFCWTDYWTETNPEPEDPTSLVENIPSIAGGVEMYSASGIPVGQTSTADLSDLCNRLTSGMYIIRYKDAQTQYQTKKVWIK